MGFRKARKGYDGINKSLDSIESKLKDIEIAFLRAKTSWLERQLEKAVESQPVPSFQPFQAPKLPPALSQLAKPLRPFDALAKELSKPFKPFDALAKELSKPLRPSPGGSA
ncbi:MAG: hypothetical protein OXK82_05895 [Deltaproteobacteria bacterium]|nr:hypothetical protein [Deltaproteobacteria bacterium]